MEPRAESSFINFCIGSLVPYWYLLADSKKLQKFIITIIFDFAYDVGNLPGSSVIKLSSW